MSAILINSIQWLVGAVTSTVALSKNAAAFSTLPPSMAVAVRACES